MTKLPNHGSKNDRCRGAVDLSLLRDPVSHGDPRVLRMPPRWRQPFGAMARAVGLEEADLKSAKGALCDSLAAFEAA